MVNFDKIFLINLKTRKDRLEFMLFKLSKTIYKDVKIIEAVNGYSEDIIQFYDKYKNRKYYGGISSPGAIGLLYTWKNILKECIENKYKKILIFEDDIYFHKNYNNIIEENSKLFDKYNVVLLGGNQERWDSDQLEQIKNSNFYEHSKDKWCCTYGTYGISLDNIAIETIYETIKGELEDNTPTIDVQINILIRLGKLNGVTMYPSVVIPETRDSDNMKEREMSEMSKSRKWILEDYDYINIYDTIINYRQNKINIRQNTDLLKLKLKLNNKTILSIFDGKQLPFVFIIPSYNNSKWVENNLKSVFNQNYYNWRAIYIDDNSEDDTFIKAQNLVENEGMTNRFTFIKNSIRKYQAYNRYIAYTTCYDEEICVMLDGDDWLSHNEVLSVLNEEYKKHNLLVSYGQFSYFENNRIGMTSGKYNFPKDVIKNCSYRKYQWISQHLRTCKASIIKNIPIIHLQDMNGEWLKSCTDMAEMFYVLENSNGQHKNIGSVLCIYNKDNSIQYPNSYYNENRIQRDKLIEYIRNHSKITNKILLNNKDKDKDKDRDKNKNKNEICYTKEISSYSKCYQMEFSQYDTFIIPVNSTVDYYLFMINVQLTDTNNYTFQICDKQEFEILKYSKIKEDKYIIYIKNKCKIKKIGVNSFNIIAKCDNDSKYENISQKFDVFSYGNIFNYTANNINKILVIDPLIREHGQDISIIKGNKWELQNDYLLIKVIPNCIISKSKVYHIKLKFNEKIIDIIVNFDNK